MADKDFRLAQKPTTDSRVSLMSGVHRKEVNRLRQELATDADIVPSVVSLGAQLVAVWLGSAQYLDENNRPKPLSRFVSEGGEIATSGPASCWTSGCAWAWCITTKRTGSA